MQYLLGLFQNSICLLKRQFLAFFPSSFLSKASFERGLLFLLLVIGSTSCSEVIEPSKVDHASVVPNWVVGDWQFTDDTGIKTTVKLYPDGSAIGLDNTIGSWFFLNNTIHIVWTSGWMNLIQKHDKGYVKFGFTPGVPTDGSSTNESKAIKLSEQPINYD